MIKDTIAAIATGITPAGIGIIRISGEDAFNVASSVFRRKSGVSIDSFESHRVYYGYVYDSDSLLDEILLIPMKGPHSYTGEDTVELQCHGGILVMRKILDVVLKAGAKCAEPGEFTKRAFLNGRIDLSEAEAVMDVISSENDLALNNSVKLMTGKLFDKISFIRSKLLYEVAYIESALDDPEHYSLDGYSDKLRETIVECINSLNSLKNSFNNGKILKDGVRTVILGKPNVGKSSLLNLLVGEEKAIVTHIPGTTRDVIEETLLLDSMMLRIVDTAGIRESDDVVEQIGIDKAINYAKEADLIIMMLDGSDTISEQDEQIFSFIRANNKKCVILLNKSDLSHVLSKEDISCYTSAKIIQFSTVDETGLDELKEFIKDQFYSGLLNINDDIFLTNARQAEALSDSIDSLNKVIVSIDDMMPEDFFSIDLNDAYISLGKIIGEGNDDDVINEIFGKFCMGK